jgi:hypothetical protein
VVNDHWSCGNRKDIEAGDRLFLLRQREEPRGIIGSGWATGPTHQDLHWDQSRAKQGQRANFVPLRFDKLIDPEVDDILGLSVLKSGRTGAVNWYTQASGILIDPSAASELEEIWAQHLGSSAGFDDEVSALEGETRRYLITHRRRERPLRDAKLAAALHINAGRLRCEVPGCGFDFWEVYGSLGRHYAQVHHLDPLGTRVRASRTRLNDLVVVCANCHVMIHRGGACRSIQRLIRRRLNASRTS